MTYEKPEISVLGDAVDVIKGNRSGTNEPQSFDGTQSDSELDD